MKLIFLDIDGVLNHQLFYNQKNIDSRYFEAKDGVPEGAWNIDPEKVGLLNNLIDATGAKVVISSSWRNGRSVSDLIELFDYFGFKGEIIGKTPYLWFGHDQGEEWRKTSVPRGCEIKAWIENNKGIIGENVSKLQYVIFDDDSDMLWQQREHFIWVDAYAGLTPNLMHKAQRLLL